jgi:hypothetical protein
VVLSPALGIDADMIIGNGMRTCTRTSSFDLQPGKDWAVLVRTMAPGKLVLTTQLPDMDWNPALYVLWQHQTSGCPEPMNAAQDSVVVWHKGYSTPPSVALQVDTGYLMLVVLEGSNLQDCGRIALRMQLEAAPVCGDFICQYDRQVPACWLVLRPPHVDFSWDLHALLALHACQAATGLPGLTYCALRALHALAAGGRGLRIARSIAAASTVAMACVTAPKPWTAATRTAGQQCVGMASAA